MDRKLQERMVGAAVLILALVIVGPMVLDGGPEPAVDEDVPGQRDGEVRSHTFQIGEGSETRPATSATAGTAPAQSPQATPSAPPPKPEPSPAPVAVAPKPATAPATPAPVEAPVSAPAPKPASKPAPSKPPPPSAPASSGAWVAQVGTFGQKDNANRLVAKLRAGGFDAFVSPTTRDGKTLYRVRVGPAGTRDAAGEVASRLAATGQSGQVVAQ